MIQPLLVKLGGSLITDKRGDCDALIDVIDRLASELAEAARRGNGPVILGHGSGSFGHRVAAKFDLAAGLGRGEQLSGLSQTQRTARDLHRILIRALENQGLNPFSLPPSSWMVSQPGKLEVLTLEPLKQALHLGLLPVVFGDVILDRSQGVSIASTEQVFLAIAQALEGSQVQPKRAIWLGNTPGVLDREGRLIRSLRPEFWSESHIDNPEVTDVTGGIRLRVDTTFSMARRGIPSLVTDGTVPGRLLAALNDPNAPGTLVPTLE